MEQDHTLGVADFVYSPQSRWVEHFRFYPNHIFDPKSLIVQGSFHISDAVVNWLLHHPLIIPSPESQQSWVQLFCKLIRTFCNDVQVVSEDTLTKTWNRVKPFLIANIDDNELVNILRILMRTERNKWVDSFLNLFEKDERVIHNHKILFWTKNKHQLMKLDSLLTVSKFTARQLAFVLIKMSTNELFHALLDETKHLSYHVFTKLDNIVYQMITRIEPRPDQTLEWMLDHPKLILSFCIEHDKWIKLFLKYGYVTQVQQILNYRQTPAFCQILQSLQGKDMLPQEEEGHSMVGLAAPSAS